MKEIQLEKILEDYLENKSLEDFLEEFNITPLEVVILLFDEGLLDEYQLDRLVPSDV